MKFLQKFLRKFFQVIRREKEICEVISGGTPGVILEGITPGIPPEITSQIASGILIQELFREFFKNLVTIGSTHVTYFSQKEKRTPQ